MHLFTVSPRLLLLLIFVLALPDPAEASGVILNPDPRTAWVQKNDEFDQGEGISPDHWTLDPRITVVPGKDGLQVVAEAAAGGGIPRIVRVMPFDPYYSWLQFDISDVAQKEGGYRMFSVNAASLGAPARSSIANLQEGRYVTRLVPGAGKENDRQFQMRFDVSGFQFVLNDLSMRHDPLPRLEVQPVDASKKIPSIGDEMKVTVYLAEPAEDVSVRLLNSYLLLFITFGGEGELQLKPEDPEAKIWSATFVLEEMKVYPFKKGKQVPAGRLLFKASILGGNFPQPLLNWNETPWDVIR